MHAETRGQHQVSCLSTLCVTPEAGSLSECGVGLAWLVACEPQWSFCLCLTLWQGDCGRVTRVCSLAWFLHGCWYQNSGPWAWAESILTYWAISPAPSTTRSVIGRISRQTNRERNICRWLYTNSLTGFHRTLRTTAELHPPKCTWRFSRMSA